MELRELFRSRLKNAEVVPDLSVNLKLMRKLARREFMKFNPVRFNVYYLGGILVAGITAAIILSSDRDTTASITDDSLKTETSRVTGFPVVAHQDTVIEKTATGILSEENTAKNRSNTRAKTEASQGTPAGQSLKDAQKMPVSHTDRLPALPQNDLFKKTVIDTSKLINSGAKGVERLFISSVSEGCVPLKVRFINMSDEFYSCRWTFGDGGSSVEKAPEWIFDVDGDYKIVLEIFSSGKLIASSSSIIKVYPRPVANFELSPEKAIIPDDEVHFINYSTDAVRYIWDFGDGMHSQIFEPQHKYVKYGNYSIKLIAFNENGCSDSLMVQNAFTGSAYFIDFPNAFIPNPNGPSGGIYSSKSDESAQVFHPVFSGVTEYQLKIFSKMGILIFESNDINIGWDGYFKGQLSNSGVYIWKVRGKYHNGEPFTKMGDITLLKN